MDLCFKEKICRLKHIDSLENELKNLCSANKYSSIFLISDKTVWDLYGKYFTAFLPTQSYILSPGESSKNLDYANDCWSYMHSVGVDRSSLIIGLGGGVVTDFAGFIASCYMRGIDHYLIPTTLLGMVDAAIGGKTGLNLPRGKNLIGSFSHPKEVWYYLPFLKSLSDREYKAGLAEVIKYGMACDADLFYFLETHINELNQRDFKIIDSVIKKSCELKLDIVERDEREQGVRSILNWGHTFGHAIEAATGYNKYLHGEAVAIGMSCAAHFSQLIGLLDAEVVARQDFLCQDIGLNTQLPEISHDVLIDFMSGDKKSKSKEISLIVARGIGQVFKMEGVDRFLIKKALKKKGDHVK